MRELMVFLGAAIGLISTGNSSAVEILMEPAPVENIYFAEGYDSNDQVEIVLFGHLPNGCYKSGTVDVEVDHGNPDEAGRIFIKALMAHYHYQLCTEILVDYSETVRVGFLKAKEYKVVLTSHNNRVAPELLTIKESSSSERDDFVYLPVEYVRLVKKPIGQELVLVGTYPSQTGRCLKPDHHKAYTNSAGSVLVVMPIAKVYECDRQDKAEFEYRIRLEDHILVEENMMVHVRALNGRSVNKVFDHLFYSVN